ncbi:hypothetical protein ACFVYD_24250 [Streptomyces sp. NPDC058301]|uniref:hypothetical protein n=1 Tax=Streptomyces sp. NPDC058301 TaxID=3346436 RepID=UPI0036E5A71E
MKADLLGNVAVARSASRHALRAHAERVEAYGVVEDFGTGVADQGRHGPRTHDQPGRVDVP